MPRLYTTWVPVTTCYEVVTNVGMQEPKSIVIDILAVFSQLYITESPEYYQCELTVE